MLYKLIIHIVTFALRWS